MVRTGAAFAIVHDWGGDANDRGKIERLFQQKGE
jgi:hypothetical protein